MTKVAIERIVKIDIVFSFIQWEMPNNNLRSANPDQGYATFLAGGPISKSLKILQAYQSSYLMLLLRTNQLRGNGW